MGILKTTDLEILIHHILEDSSIKSDDIAMNIVNSLANADYLRDDVATTEYLKMIDLINEILEQPCHPKNTPEQDLWCKARGISHELQNHKNRENGYIKEIGKVYTTQGTYNS